MNCRDTIAPLFVAVFIVGCGETAEIDPTGTWRGQTAGQSAVNLRPKSFRETWTIKDGKITTDTGFGVTYTYRIDVNNEPKHFDMTRHSPGQPDELRLGIYKIEGDILSVCSIVPTWADRNATRPEEFYPTERKDCMTVTFQREK
jgi:uncharacterized protein (TIGR03067 family)